MGVECLPQLVVRLVRTFWEYKMSVVTIAGRAVAAVAVAAAGASLVGFTPASAAVASATVAVPGGLQVGRAGADLSTLNITWKPVAGAARYTVTVFDGVNQNAFNVAADATSFTYTGAGECTRYRVVVTAWDAAGGSASTNPFLVAPLAPGGITNMTLNRSNDGGTATIGSRPSSRSSYAPVANYKVLFRALADGSVLVERNSPDAGETVSGLEAARTYVAEIVRRMSSVRVRRRRSWCAARSPRRRRRCPRCVMRTTRRP